MGCNTRVVRGISRSNGIQPTQLQAREADQVVLAGFCQFLSAIVPRETGGRSSGMNWHVLLVARMTNAFAAGPRGLLTSFSRQRPCHNGGLF